MKQEFTYKEKEIYDRKQQLAFFEVLFKIILA